MFINKSSSNYQTVATYSTGGGFGHDSPAVVAFTFGAGRVVLFGTHPEIEEDNDHDDGTTDTVLLQNKPTLDDHGSGWYLMDAVIEWLVSQ